MGPPARKSNASAGEKAALWREMVAEWSSYDDYQRRTDHEIPVVLLERS